MEMLEENVRSLYRLDQHAADAAGRQELGPMPRASVVLLSSLAGVWLLIALYVGIGAIKKIRRAS